MTAVISLLWLSR